MWRWMGRSLRRRRQRWDDEGAEARGRGEHAKISDDMAPGRRHRGREACQQGQGLHFYRGGTVAERFLQEQAHVAVGGDLQSLVGHGRTKYIFDQRLAAAGVLGPGDGGRVKPESGVVDAQGGLDGWLGMAAMTPKRDQRGLAASGSRGRQAVDRR